MERTLGPPWITLLEWVITRKLGQNTNQVGGLREVRSLAAESGAERGKGRLSAQRRRLERAGRAQPVQRLERSRLLLEFRDQMLVKHSRETRSIDVSLWYADFYSLFIATTHL